MASGGTTAQTGREVSKRTRGRNAAVAYKTKRGFGGNAGKMDRAALKKAYGQTAYQKKIYGKNYKLGTLSKLNKKATTSHDNAKQLRENLSKIKATLSTASGDTAEALKARIAKVSAAETTATENNKTASKQRSNLVDLRKSAAVNVVRKSAENPKAVAEARKKMVEGQLKRAKKPKGTSVA